MITQGYHSCPVNLYRNKISVKQKNTVTKFHEVTLNSILSKSVKSYSNCTTFEPPEAIRLALKVLLTAYPSCFSVRETTLPSMRMGTVKSTCVMEKIPYEQSAILYLRYSFRFKLRCLFRLPLFFLSLFCNRAAVRSSLCWKKSVVVDCLLVKSNRRDIFPSFPHKSIHKRFCNTFPTKFVLTV